MEIPLLTDLVILAILSIGVLLLCARCRIPSVVGLLLTGVLSGPHGLALIARVSEVEVLAEIGVILLLFVIGIEFSLKRLMRIKRLVLMGGALQVGITALITCVLARSGLAASMGQAVFYGFLVALSSTAIVLKLLQDKGLIETPHGQSVLAILIFQDIAVVPMMMLTPLLGGGAGSSTPEVLLLLGEGVLVMAAVLLAAQVAVPYLLFHIAKTRNTQLFILSILTICFTVAWITSSIGLSLALGAFLAGLIISESEYSLHATGYVLPFEQIFTSFFFVSIGMLVNLGFVVSHLTEVLAVTTIVITLKLIIASLVILVLGYPLRTAILVGMSLCQVGEFAFILAAVGAKHKLIAGDSYQLFLAISLCTMALTPFFIGVAPWVVQQLHKLKLPEFLQKGRIPEEEIKKERFHDHVVIVGFGVCGRNLAWVAEQIKVPYVILDTNPETVRKERKKGRLIYFGDASQRSVLEQVDIEEARVVVIAINDSVAARRTIEVMRQINPKLYIIVRSRFAQEMEPMTRLGANEVIPEDFEASLAILASVLRKYLTPQEDIERFFVELRSQGYEVMRGLAEEKITLSDLQLNLSTMEIAVHKLDPQSPLVGLSLEESALRPRHKVTLLMLRREEDSLLNPGPDIRFRSGDVLVLFGANKALSRFTQLTRGS